MSRKMPNFENIADFERQWDEAPKNHSKSYEIKVVTPMVGGGVEAGKNDKDMLIRPTSIRGHLRFWWRATRGKEFNSVEKMRERENEIWGSTETPSQVQIKVKSHPSGSSRTQQDNYGFDRFGPEAYALFSASHSILKEGGEFTIAVNYPKAWDEKTYQEQVEPAIWAWVNFGGIGARTRRGCGALFCNDFAPSSMESIGTWFSDHLQKYGYEPTMEPRKWPTVPIEIYIKKNPTTPLESWKQAILMLKMFRQGNGVGRDGDRGRSFWPEPNVIRQITNRHDQNHKQPFPESKQVHSVFPRAEFGLPIIFHFVDSSDPRNTTLLPVVDNELKERMSSQLILRPLVLADGNAVPCVMQLNTIPVNHVRLTKSENDQSFSVRSENLQYCGSPLLERSSRGSAIEGFMKFMTEKGFEEVPQATKESR